MISIEGLNHYFNRYPLSPMYPAVSTLRLTSVRYPVGILANIRSRSTCENTIQIDDTRTNARIARVCLRLRRRYTRELAEGDESISASWKRIRDGLHLTLSSLGVDGVGRVKASEMRELQRILDTEIPALRRQAAPVQFSFFGTTSTSKES